MKAQVWVCEACEIAITVLSGELSFVCPNCGPVCPHCGGELKLKPAKLELGDEEAS